MEQSHRSTARSLPPFHDRAWRDLARFVGEAMAAGLFASVVLALATFIVSAHAAAASLGDTAVPGGSQRFVAVATTDRARGFQPPRPLGVGIVVSIALGSTVSTR